MTKSALWVTCLIIAGLLGHLAVAQNSGGAKAAKILIAEEFRVVDSNGIPRGAIGCLPNGAVHVSLKNSENGFSIYMPERGAVQFSTLDSNGKIIASYQLQSAPPTTPPAPKEEPPLNEDAIETYIDGEFNGWEGETIFKLSNGQLWQQATYAYAYHYAYRPKVTIYKATSGFKMKVEGMEDTIGVRRLR